MNLRGLGTFRETCRLMALSAALKRMKRRALTVKDLRLARDMILKNIRQHCGELYGKQPREREACRIAAAIAAAEVADVFKEEFGIEI